MMQSAPLRLALASCLILISASADQNTQDYGPSRHSGGASLRLELKHAFSTPATNKNSNQQLGLPYISHPTFDEELSSFQSHSATLQSGSDARRDLVEKTEKKHVLPKPGSDSSVTQSIPSTTIVLSFSPVSGKMNIVQQSILEALLATFLDENFHVSDHQDPDLSPRFILTLKDTWLENEAKSVVTEINVDGFYSAPLEITGHASTVNLVDFSSLLRNFFRANTEKIVAFVTDPEQSTEYFENVSETRYFSSRHEAANSQWEDSESAVVTEAHEESNSQWEESEKSEESETDTTSETDSSSLPSDETDKIDGTESSVTPTSEMDATDRSDSSVVSSNAADTVDGSESSVIPTNETDTIGRSYLSVAFSNETGAIDEIDSSALPVNEAVTTNETDSAFVSSIESRTIDQSEMPVAPLNEADKMDQTETSAPPVNGTDTMDFHESGGEDAKTTDPPLTTSFSASVSEVTDKPHTTHPTPSPTSLIKSVIPVTPVYLRLDYVWDQMNLPEQLLMESMVETFLEANFRLSRHVDINLFHPQFQVSLTDQWIIENNSQQVRRLRGEDRGLSLVVAFSVSGEYSHPAVLVARLSTVNLLNFQELLHEFFRDNSEELLTYITEAKVQVSYFSDVENVESLATWPINANGVGVPRSAPQKRGWMSGMANRLSPTMALFCAILLGIVGFVLLTVILRRSYLQEAELLEWSKFWSKTDPTEADGLNVSGAAEKTGREEYGGASNGETSGSNYGMDEDRPWYKGNKNDSDHISHTTAMSPYWPHNALSAAEEERYLQDQRERTEHDRKWRDLSDKLAREKVNELDVDELLRVPIRGAKLKIFGNTHSPYDEVSQMTAEEDHRNSIGKDSNDRPTSPESTFSEVDKTGSDEKTPHSAGAPQTSDLARQGADKTEEEKQREAATNEVDHLKDENEEDATTLETTKETKARQPLTKEDRKNPSFFSFGEVSGEENTNEMSVEDRKRDCYAPPGKLGVRVDSKNGFPVVSSVKPDSPLHGVLFPGDRLLAVDDQDVTNLAPHKVTKMMVKRKDKWRKISFLPES